MVTQTKYKNMKKIILVKWLKLCRGLRNKCPGTFLSYMPNFTGKIYQCRLILKKVSLTVQWQPTWATIGFSDLVLSLSGWTTKLGTPGLVFSITQYSILCCLEQLSRDEVSPKSCLAPHTSRSDSLRSDNIFNLTPRSSRNNTVVVWWICQSGELLWKLSGQSDSLLKTSEIVIFDYLILKKKRQK